MIVTSTAASRFGQSAAHWQLTGFSNRGQLPVALLLMSLALTPTGRRDLWSHSCSCSVGGRGVVRGGGEVVSSDHAGHLVVRVHHQQVAQAQGAEHSVRSLK